MRFLKDLSLSAATAGFVAVLVGFTSSVAIVFQAALAFNATPALITSWMWALGWAWACARCCPPGPAQAGHGGLVHARCRGAGHGGHHRAATAWPMRWGLHRLRGVDHAVWCHRLVRKAS
jgi:hypothetical protein